MVNACPSARKNLQLNGPKVLLVLQGSVKSFYFGFLACLSEPAFK